jgi:hypothetical protein
VEAHASVKKNGAQATPTKSLWWAQAMAGDGVGALGPRRGSGRFFFGSAYISRPRTVYRFSSLG